MSWVELRFGKRYDLDPDSLFSASSSLEAAKLQPPPAPSSGGTKLSPTLIFIIVVLAVVCLIAVVLNFFIRFLIKHRSSSASVSETETETERYSRSSRSSRNFQRQLRQLFHSHDSGLDQACIDALPVFLYKEIIGLKEPFDCAVCLCEFSEQDKLRLLPLCSHAFHMSCIDTWLLSNSTCPLCRGVLFSPGFSIENPIYEFPSLRDDSSFSNSFRDRISFGPKPGENDISKRVFSVRLGKFKNINLHNGKDRVANQEGETSSSNLDARRCFSMGSCQYVEADLDLQVALCEKNIHENSHRSTNGSVLDIRIGKGVVGNSSADGDIEGKKISCRSKGESYSVSKIWLWPKKGILSSAPNTCTSTFNVNFSSDR